MKLRLLVTMAVLLAANRAHAHDVWLTFDGLFGPLPVAVNYGHPGDRPPASIDKVIDLVAFDASHEIDLRPGMSIAIRNNAVVALSKPVNFPASLIVACRYDNGFWARTSDGYRNATKRMLGPVTESVWSAKFAKLIGRAADDWSRVIGHELEIVPLSAPTSPAPGRAFKVRVLFRGKPLADAEVERGDGFTAVPEPDIPRFKTDRDGVAIVPLVRSGATLLVVDHRVAPSLTPDQADADLYNATLQFEAP